MGAGGGAGAATRGPVRAVRLGRFFGLVMSTETGGRVVTPCGVALPCALAGCDNAAVPRQSRAAMLREPRWSWIGRRTRLAWRDIDAPVPVFLFRTFQYCIRVDEYLYGGRNIPNKPRRVT